MDIAQIVFTNLLFYLNIALLVLRAKDEEETIQAEDPQDTANAQLIAKLFKQWGNREDGYAVQMA